LIPARVTALRSVEIGVTDMAVALDFYTRVWGLVAVGEAHGIHYLRGAGRFHHILTLRPASRATVIRCVFDAADRAAVDALHAQVVVQGGRPAAAPQALAWPGGGYGFGFKDREDRNFALVCEIEDHPHALDDQDRPTRLSHLNLNAADNDGTVDLLVRGLGFVVSDHNDKFRFLRCGRDHHSLVVGFNDRATLNHIAFEMAGLDAMMRGAGRMRDDGYPIEWGPGRHGPGNNLFCYFCGPEEMPLEYTAEMQQVDADYRTGTPADWKWPARRIDRWGVSDPPSRRVVRAQSLIRFTPDGDRL
jgi:catechol 2,3-dioxygenase